MFIKKYDSFRYNSIKLNLNEYEQLDHFTISSSTEFLFFMKFYSIRFNHEKFVVNAVLDV